MKDATDYLALAKNADKAAENAETELARRTWQAMAQHYRALAARKLQERRAG